ncbi:MAG: Panacea domain-containing protein [Thermoanaerobaculia bacterium]
MAKSNKGRDKRLQELILYVARETESDPKCGKTKLYKILFYSDFWAHQRLGTSISHQEYQRLDFGPAPRRGRPILEEMISSAVAAWAVRDYFGRTLQKLLALREPDLSVFSGEEIAIVQEVVRILWPYDASEVSGLSHRFIGWQLAREGEVIPYSTVALGQPRQPTLREIAYGQKLARELGD